MKLEILSDLYAVCRLEAAAPVPPWAQSRSFLSITRTEDELSIVCPQSAVPAEIKCERDWITLKVLGPLDFSLTGILASLANPLAAAQVSIFAISTFDTDYLLIKQSNRSKAIAHLTAAGFEIR